jgi:AbrB family looped-hinge helix DNA binding protein
LHCHLAMASDNLTAMQIHVDKAGRMVLPKAIREQLGITPDSTLELLLVPDGVLLRRVADAPSMRLVGGLWVHQGAAQPNADRHRIVDKIRDKRDTGA